MDNRPNIKPVENLPWVIQIQYITFEEMDFLSSDLFDATDSFIRCII